MTGAQRQKPHARWRRAGRIELAARSGVVSPVGSLMARRYRSSAFDRSARYITRDTAPLRDNSTTVSR